MRLFIGLEIPAVIRASIRNQACVLSQLSPGKYVREDMYHITLVYIGNCSDEMRILAAECMKSVAAGTKPMKLAPGTVSYFGKPEKAILHLDVKNSGLLQPVSDALRSKLTDVGLSFDSKPLVPHITLARNVRITDELLNIGAPHESFTAAGLTLFNSCLVDDVLRYIPIERAKFAGGK